MSQGKYFLIIVSRLYQKTAKGSGVEIPLNLPSIAVYAVIVASLEARRWQAGPPLLKGDFIVPPLGKGGMGGLKCRRSAVGAEEILIVKYYVKVCLDITVIAICGKMIYYIV